ncbi:QacE family quaternary ammonium compound efflux SMR transporter [Vagococcus coleopterorum]|uniref:QacE family quaternary ammonium compound efflux SMR transporter n=1 Tax=Vagococcus coleopterorum TaxID=2714946 RepID=A0A6G8ANF0_9ENTE|nr:SMR family transporter [Vagococcus coleopterorum]QIL46453.1 QacE family quaternary ammonium compound efflux SMR transporter [Vagococcus coleopterorum]
MAWLALIGAGLMEVIGVWNLKRVAEGNFKAILFAFFTMGSSLLLLSVALQEIPMGTGYAIWTGIGTVGTAIVGIVLYKDSTDRKRLACIALILLSTVALKLVA